MISFKPLRPGAAVFLAIAAAGCDPRIVVGSDAPDGGGDGGPMPLLVPWSTGFENGFADWGEPPNEGFCYFVGSANFQIVNSPVHGGQHAAAFSVNTSLASPSHARCLRQGVLPASAYYGAFYYVPAPATNRDNWNLLHFQGANVVDGGAAHGLWDVSLKTEADGSVATSVYDFLRTRSLDAGPSIPIGAWFHVEVFLRRSAGDTGRFTVYVDGQVVLDLQQISTDDSLWGQWFVGNYATALSPGASVVYVDDVTIGTVRSGP